MFVVRKKENEVYSLPAKEITHRQAKEITSELAFKIVKKLAEKPMYPLMLAKALRVHEQKVYYHIRNLEAAGLIQVTSQKQVQGAVAKYYSVEKPAFVVMVREMEKTTKFSPQSSVDFLEPFIRDGQLNASIIVGSPDPHGPDKARSRDGYYGIDLALFLGTYLTYVPRTLVMLDTEARERDMQNNLILIGGPIVNKVTQEVHTALPLYFDKEQNWAVYSKISGQSYPSDEVGIIVAGTNPFNKKNKVLLVAGRRFSGTRAAIIAFIKHFDVVQEGNVHKKGVLAKVVEGIDLDSDGIIDDVEFRE